MSFNDSDSDDGIGVGNDGVISSWDSSDDELDEIFSIWSKPEVIDLINEVGDIENPITLGLKMVREIPEFRKVASKAMKALFWG